MARIRQHSQSQALFVGPSPSSGFHFVDQHGSPTGNSDAHNIIKQINGVQSVGYQVDIPRQDVSEVGRRELVDRPIISPPTVNLSFTYFTADLRNEVRMGFDVNFPTGHSYSNPFYPNNRDVFLFSGLTSRNLYPAFSGYSAWPYEDKDCRNFYLAIAPEGVDVKDMPSNRFGEMSSIAFGECYINNYAVVLDINSPIVCTTAYTCYNMTVEESGSGLVPSVSATGMTQENENIYVIPSLKGEISGFNVRSGVSTIAKTNDIKFSIKSTGYSDDTSGILDMVLDLSDMNAQNVQFNVDFNRTQYIGLGYRIPEDLPMKYPIVCQAQIGALMGEAQFTKIKNLIELDNTVDIIIEARSPRIYCPGFDPNQIIARYDFLGSKVDSLSFETNVNEATFANLTFSTDVAKGVTGKGLFMSGKVLETGEAFSGYNF